VADAWLATHPHSATALYVSANLAKDDRTKTSFAIPTHVHVCTTTDGSVLLDVKRDRYFGLGREETLLLAAVMPEWPRPRWDCAPIQLPDADCERRALNLCESLLEDGLLVGEARCPRLSRAEPLRRDWVSIGDELEVACRLGISDLLNFGWAYLWVRCSLRWRPLSATVESIRALKSRPGVVTWKARDVAEMVAVFRRLRPWVFAAEGRCLLHALTLVKFCSLYDFHPQWLIGVATQPWGAHSWVQWDNFLLDTNPEKVCGYIPIMEV
jgi:hypothetical protein